MSYSNPFIGWSDELLKSYKDLPLPTLYDFAVSGEKLSLEIRKQNKEIKQLRETIEGLTKQITSQEEVLLRFKLKPDADKKMYQRSLMQAFDSLLMLKEQVSKSAEEVPRALTFKRGKFKKQQSEQTQKVENTLDSFLDGLDLIEDKFLSSLADLDLIPFAPEQGDTFVPQEHRAVVQVSGDLIGKIHKTIRIGYKSSEGIVRCADVAVYQIKR